MARIRNINGGFLFVTGQHPDLDSSIGERLRWPQERHLAACPRSPMRPLDGGSATKMSLKLAKNLLKFCQPVLTKKLLYCRVLI